MDAKPKAIVFDYGDTLLKSDFFKPIEGVTELLKYAHNPRNVGAGEIQKYADSILKDVIERDSSQLMQINSMTLSRLIYEAHGITFSKSYDELDVIFLSAAEGTSLMPGIVEFLQDLKLQGIRLAVLSNTGFSEESHRQQLRKHGIEDYFEFFIATSDYLVRKPDRRVFDVALAKLDLSAQEVWYIGNKFEYDILGAHNAGLYPVWINEQGEAEHFPIEHLSVPSFHALRTLMQKYKVVPSVSL